jgi:hypothetical protein
MLRQKSCKEGGEGFGDEASGKISLLRRKREN